MAANGIRASVNGRAWAEGLSAAATRDKVNLKIHLKVDTGMGRAGLPW